MLISCVGIVVMREPILKSVEEHSQRLSERFEFGIKSDSRQKTKSETKEQQSKMRILGFPFRSKW